MVNRPPPKTMQTIPVEKRPVIVTVPEGTVARYDEASNEVEELLGLTPGPEFLMSLAVEHQDPFELSNVFLGEIIAHFGKR
jgi:hypothetical protein